MSFCFPTGCGQKNNDRDKVERRSCAFCPKQFVFYGDLLRHESTVHTKKVTKTFECQTCHRTFLHQNSLRAHYRATSHNVTNSDNEKLPTRMNNVLRTSNVSDAVICNDTYNSNNNNNPYECRFCGVQMNDASNLRSHERVIHFGDRPHGCEICGKYFSKKHDLKQHLLVHSPKRTFQCSVCLKTFKSQKGWTKHKRNAHQDVIKSCLEVTISDKNDE